MASRSTTAGTMTSTKNAGRAMATATSDRSRVGAAAVSVALAALLAGCAAAGHDQASSRADGPLGSVRPAAPPVAWRTVALSTGRATLRYPRGWHPARSDPGTLTYIRSG